MVIQNRDMVVLSVFNDVVNDELCRSTMLMLNFHDLNCRMMVTMSCSIIFLFTKIHNISITSSATDVEKFPTASPIRRLRSFDIPQFAH